MNTASQKYRLELFEILTSRFNLQEFQTLCFAIPVNYDLLEGGDLGSKARELVLFMMRYGRLQELVETGRTIRPDITWPNIPSSKTQKQDWKKFDKELARARSTPIQVKVRPGTGRSKLFMFSRAIATMIVFAVLFQVFGGPIIEAVTCGPGMPMPCLALGNSWWIIGAMLGFLTGLGLLPESSGSK